MGSLTMAACLYLVTAVGAIRDTKIDETSPDQVALLSHSIKIESTKHPSKASKKSSCLGQPHPKQQLSGYAMESICSALHSGGAKNMLVFGLGFDASLWYKNTEGKLLFLELHQKWVAMQSSEIKNITHVVKYTTTPANYDVPRDEAKLAAFFDSLPAEVRTTRWDVILVDGPEGMEDAHNNLLRGVPGRMQSVYAASRLAHAGTTIFVDDYERRIERELVETLLKPQFHIEEEFSSGHIDGKVPVRMVKLRSS